MGRGLRFKTQVGGCLEEKDVERRFVSGQGGILKDYSRMIEGIPQETLEALRAMGAGRVKVFFSAVLPSAFTGMLAWTSISFESNFEASAVLGTVGAGGIGYVISNCMTRYAYGQAIVAIALVLAFTYAMELGFTAIKERNGKIK